VEQSIIDEFNKQYEGQIVVTGVPMTGVETKLPVAVAGNAAPAVVKIDRVWVGSFASSGVIQALDSLISRDKFDTNGFFPAARLENVYKGKTYGLPWTIDDRALIYNTRIMAQSGLDVKAPPRTFSQLDTASRKIDKKDAQGIFTQVGFIPWWGGWGFPGFLWSAGGDVLDNTNRKITFNNEVGVVVAKWMDVYLKNYGGDAGIAKLGAGGKMSNLANGQMGLTIDGNWKIGDYRSQNPDLEYAVSAPPRLDGLEATPVTWSGGWGVAMPSGISAEQREAGWKFMQFYTSHWAQVQLGAKIGRMPALRSAAISREYLTYDERVRTFVDLMNYSRFRPVTPVGLQLQPLYYGQLMNGLRKGDKPVEQVLDEYARQAQIVLDEGWAKAQN
jgi:ABC-type glycerol-3-phosphate transport system substrate-binding protein